MKKKCLLFLLVFGIVVESKTLSSEASTAGITSNVKLSEYYGEYTYGDANNILMINSIFYEIHSTTRHCYMNNLSETVTPGHRTVSVRRKSDLGYRYTKVSFYGYVNGVCKACLEEVKP